MSAALLEPALLGPDVLAAGPVPEAARVRLAASSATPGGVLAALAHDPAVTIRAAVATNPATPAAVQATLAADADERVRAILAHRLAALAPAADNDALGRHSASLLATLVADEAVRVRAVIADVLKDMPDAPRDLVLRLAHDTELPVAGPVLRLSPVLTTDDLLSLVAGSARTAEPIATRLGLPPDVSDAVAATGDAAAIRALLGNASAQIREATLDLLAARAAAVPEWHRPLSHRPVLSARSALALSGFVSDELLSVLSNRSDLPPAVVGELQVRLRRRLNLASDAVATREVSDAEGMKRRGALNESALLEAVRRGLAVQACARLAVAAAMPYAAVERAVALRNARALVSLAWEAGFSMRAGLAVQAGLAGLGPGQLVLGRADDTFPMPPDEMRFQLGLLRDDAVTEPPDTPS